MDIGVWRATVHGVAESDPTERLSTEQHSIGKIHGLLLNKLWIKKKNVSLMFQDVTYLCIGNNEACRIFLVLSPGWGELFLFILNILFDFLDFLPSVHISLIT